MTAHPDAALPARLRSPIEAEGAGARESAPAHGHAKRAASPPLCLPARGMPSFVTSGLNLEQIRSNTPNAIGWRVTSLKKPGRVVDYGRTDEGLHDTCFRNAGVNVIPTNNPSGSMNRLTTWPQGSFLFLTSIRYPCASSSVVASSTSSTSNSSQACGT